MFDYDELDAKCPDPGDDAAPEADGEAAREAEELQRLMGRVVVGSGGLCNPAEVERRRRAPRAAVSGPASGRRPCRVTVVTPTNEKRARFHKQLWACFEAQTWQDKELVVVETYQKSPSSVFAEKARHHEELIHMSFQRGKDFTTGLKRNIGVLLASGEVVANFDDDDCYAPEYLETMVAQLQEERLAALTLSTWFDFDTRSGRCGFVDPEAVNDLDLLPWNSITMQGADRTMPEVRELFDERVQASVYGYGFSFVYLRRPAVCHPYPDKSVGEDLPFMLGLREALGAGLVGLRRDDRGICLHVMHGGNTAASAAHRYVGPARLRELAVCSLDHVAQMLDSCRPAANPSGCGGAIGRFRVHDESRSDRDRRLRSRAEEFMLRLNALRGRGRR